MDLSLWITSKDGNTEDSVEIFADELPMDSSDMIDVLKGQWASLKTWKRAAVGFRFIVYFQGSRLIVFFFCCYYAAAAAAIVRYRLNIIAEACLTHLNKLWTS